MVFNTLKLQLHDAIYRLRFFSNSLTHILSLSNSHNNVASIQKNRGDKSHRVIVALDLLDTVYNAVKLLLFNDVVLRFYLFIYLHDPDPHRVMDTVNFTLEQCSGLFIGTTNRHSDHTVVVGITQWNTVTCTNKFF